MQNLENDGPIRRAGKCKTWKMTDHVTGGGKCRTYKNDGTNRRADNARPVTGGKTLHFVANITNILSWNYLEQVM